MLWRAGLRCIKECGEVHCIPWPSGHSDCKAPSRTAVFLIGHSLLSWTEAHGDLQCKLLDPLEKAVFEHAYPTMTLTDAGGRITQLLPARAAGSATLPRQRDLLPSKFLCSDTESQLSIQQYLTNTGSSVHVTWLRFECAPQKFTHWKHNPQFFC